MKLIVSLYSHSTNYQAAFIESYSSNINMANPTNVTFVTARVAPELKAPSVQSPVTFTPHEFQRVKSSISAFIPN